MLLVSRWMERYKPSHFASRHEPFGASATEPLPPLNSCIMTTAGQTSLFFFSLRRTLPVSSLVCLFHLNRHILNSLYFHFLFLMHINQRSLAHLLILCFTGSKKIQFTWGTKYLKNIPRSSLKAHRRSSRSTANSSQVCTQKHNTSRHVTSMRRPSCL